MAVSKTLERSDLPQCFDAVLLVRCPWSDRIVEAELSTGDIQRVIFVLVDGDLEDGVLGFGAVALVAVRFNDNDPTQISELAWFLQAKSQFTLWAITRAYDFERRSFDPRIGTD